MGQPAAQPGPDQAQSTGLAWRPGLAQGQQQAPAAARLAHRSLMSWSLSCWRLPPCAHAWGLGLSIQGAVVETAALPDSAASLAAPAALLQRPGRHTWCGQASCHTGWCCSQAGCAGTGPPPGCPVPWPLSGSHVCIERQGNGILLQSLQLPKPLHATTRMQQTLASGQGGSPGSQLRMGGWGDRELLGGRLLWRGRGCVCELLRAERHAEQLARGVGLALGRRCCGLLRLGLLGGLGRVLPCPRRGLRGRRRRLRCQGLGLRPTHAQPPDFMSAVKRGLRRCVVAPSAENALIDSSGCRKHISPARVPSWPIPSQAPLGLRGCWPVHGMSCCTRCCQMLCRPAAGPWGGGRSACSAPTQPRLCPGPWNSGATVTQTGRQAQGGLADVTQAGRETASQPTSTAAGEVPGRAATAAPLCTPNCSCQPLAGEASRAAPCSCEAVSGAASRRPCAALASASPAVS